MSRWNEVFSSQVGEDAATGSVERGRYISVAANIHRSLINNHQEQRR